MFSGVEQFIVATHKDTQQMHANPPSPTAERLVETKSPSRLAEEGTAAGHVPSCPSADAADPNTRLFRFFNIGLVVVLTLWNAVVYRSWFLLFIMTCWMLCYVVIVIVLIVANTNLPLLRRTRSHWIVGTILWLTWIFVLSFPVLDCVYFHVWSNCLANEPLSIYDELFVTPFATVIQLVALMNSLLGMMAILYCI